MHGKLVITPRYEYFTHIMYTYKNGLVRVLLLRRPGPLSWRNLKKISLCGLHVRFCKISY